MDNLVRKVPTAVDSKRISGAYCIRSGKRARRHCEFLLRWKCEFRCAGRSGEGGVSGQSDSEYLVRAPWNRAFRKLYAMPLLRCSDALFALQSLWLSLASAFRSDPVRTCENLHSLRPES